MEGMESPPPYEGRFVLYQQKVRDLLEALLREREALKHRVKELTEELNSSRPEEIDEKDKDEVIDELRTQLAELLEERASLKDQLETLTETVARLKEKEAEAEPLPPPVTPVGTAESQGGSGGPSGKKSWTYSRGSVIAGGVRLKGLPPPPSSPFRESRSQTTPPAPALTPSDSAPSPGLGSRPSHASSPLPNTYAPVAMDPNSPSNTSTPSKTVAPGNSAAPSGNPTASGPSTPTGPRPSSPTPPSTPSTPLHSTSSRRLTMHPSAVEEEEEWDDEDIVLERKKDGPVEVRGGTLPKLVERLSYHRAVDTDYVTTFLITYRSFTTPPQLFHLLVQRYHTGGAQDPEVAKIIKLRDFLEDSRLMKNTLEFVDNTLAVDLESLAQNLKKLLSELRTPSACVAEVTVTKATHFIDFDPVSVARQLTLIEQKLYRAIREEECLNQSWSKKDRDILAPNVVAMIKRFNLVSNWVSTEIVKAEKLKERVTLVKNFIKIAWEFKQMGNFNGVMELLAGLQNAAIYRLKKTWEKVESSKVNEQYQELLELMSSSENYKAYRNKMRSVSPPAIPYLGIYLTDLTFIGDGNPDQLQGRPDLINFDKRKKITVVINDIQQWQLAAYPPWEDTVVADYVSKIEGLTEKALYKYSLICEPRGGRDTPAPFSTKNLLKKFKFDPSS